jgi:DNA polymerase III subunit alpha
VSFVADFVHLHVHSEYSLRQGAVRIADLVRKCRELDMPAVAVTDTNALYGAVTFYRAAKAEGVKPIVGVQLSVGFDEDKDVLKEGRPGGPAVDAAVLLAKDFAGYQNLVRLVTLAQSRPRHPFVTFSELATHSQSLIALIAGGESEILRQFSAGNPRQAEIWLNRWTSAWPKDDLYIDIQDHGIPEERQGLPALVRWARAHQQQVVATNDVHYLAPVDAEVQRVLAQLEGHTNPHLLKGDRYDLASPAEMVHRFTHLPEAVRNTLVIADQCNLELPVGQTLLPQYPTQGDEPSSQVLRRAAEVGARQRYGQMSPEVRERLDYELSVIERLGFADYFLVVADFIRYAHKHGISTGPGRGSAAGSLVAYALRITDVDPLRHNLLFERFLNPERVSWPDIDTDFEYERRGEVIQYVVSRYGADRVAQIGTFGTLAARAAIRDAGRVLKTDPAVVDRLAKLIPSHPGVTLQKAYEEVPGIEALLQSNPHARQVWDTAKGLEGFPRHTSVHAAGVVISPIPLTDLVPVQPGADGTPVTQYAMEDIEYLGLMKMDFLGLRTLTLIDACVASVERRTGRRLDWKSISESDKKTFDMLTRGETEGCFQLESGGVRRVLRDLRPTRLDDLVAVISLYRPGPMENIPTFIAAKHGRTPIHYPHPDLEPILKDTYGVIVYQEQIMQIASLMAGFTLGQADLLRRAVGKKKRDVLDAERSRFVEGCLRRGYDEAVANSVYDLIVRFADYGFNRSHAAAYAVLAYRTAYLRAHHTPDFLAALLTMVMGDAAKTRDYIRIAKQNGIRVLPPSIQKSDYGYTAESERVIRAGLLSVRNVGRGAVDAILSARREAPFTSLADFLRRVNSRACNRKSVESLLEAGALSEFLPDGASLEAAKDILEEAYRTAEEGKALVGLGLDFRDGTSSTSDTAPMMLFIRYDSGKLGADGLKRIQQALKRHTGDIGVALYDRSRKKMRILESKWSVTLSAELIGELEELVGIGNVKTGHQPSKTGRPSL